MVKYYAVVENNYVFCVSANKFGDIISEDMYAKISNAIKNKPTPPNDFAYRLKADTLEWELIEIPKDAPNEVATPSDYEAALNRLGVEV